VARDGFGYLQTVLGYVLGYAVIAHVLLPTYYRLGLTSIYGYLGLRYDRTAQRTGAAFFLASRLLGSAARLYLAVGVFQTFVFAGWGVPFGITATAVIGLILAYTLRGGIRTLVWTDALQSGVLVAGMLACGGALMSALGLGAGELVAWLTGPSGPRLLDMDWRSPGFFWKQFAGGVAIAVVMTGLDQNSMQKTLSCRGPGDARKNLYLFTPVMVAVNVVILALGALLFRYAAERGVTAPERTDDLFPLVALRHLGGFAAAAFVLGLTAATFNSADSVLTTLTTSFCVDFLGFGTEREPDAATRDRLRARAHAGFAALLLATLLALRALAHGSEAVTLVLKLAGYTYGPLLGMFALGLYTRVRAGGPGVAVVCVLSVALSGMLDRHSAAWFGGYRLGFELLLLNGAFTAAGIALVAWLSCRPSGDR
jgi:Na+/proline symporter